MVQRGEQARFALEPCTGAGIGRHVDRQTFDRHVGFESGVAGEIDLAHSAGADERADLVLAHSTADER
jgi:hypothetical protein